MVQNHVSGHGGIVVMDIELSGETLGVDNIVFIQMTKYDSKFNKKLALEYYLNPNISLSVVQSKKMEGINLGECPKFIEIEKEILSFIKDCNIIGEDLCINKIQTLHRQLNEGNLSYNLYAHTITDLTSIDDYFKPKTLSDMYLYHLGKKMPKMDFKTTKQDLILEVFQAQSHKYKFNPLVCDIFKYNEVDDYGFIGVEKKLIVIEGKVCYTFGPFKFKPIIDNRPYAEWTLSAPNFKGDFKYIIKRELGILPEEEVNRTIISSIKKRSLR